MGAGVLDLPDLVGEYAHPTALKLAVRELVSGWYYAVMGDDDSGRSELDRGAELTVHGFMGFFATQPPAIVGGIVYNLVRWRWRGGEAIALVAMGVAAAAVFYGICWSHGKRHGLVFLGGALLGLMVLWWMGPMCFFAAAGGIP